MSIPFDQIRDVSLAQAHRLLAEWFPNGRVIGREFKVGNIAGDPGESLRINLNTGKWSDFAAGIGGPDLIGVFAAMKHNSDRTAAAREMGPMLGIRMNGHDTSGEGTRLTEEAQAHRRLAANRPATCRRSATREARVRGFQPDLRLPQCRR